MNTTDKGIGDITSDEKGTGARYNAGKAPLELLPVTVLAAWCDYINIDDRQDVSALDSKKQIILAMRELGYFQNVHHKVFLFHVLDYSGFDPHITAQVFDYGRKKYAAWNWAKGMPWSVPLGCALRHLHAILSGEELDQESGLPHIGHVWCNIIMLITYCDHYQAGNDLPTVFMKKEKEAVAA